MKPRLPPDYALKLARAGDPGLLIANLQQTLQGRGHLSDGEYWFIIEALEATESKQTRARLRDLERWLIAQQFDGLVDGDAEFGEKGMEPKLAMDVVKKNRNCSIRKIRGALKAYGKPRRYRA
jgi:hypothetical protein